jgi:hypothetical protein
MFRNVVVYISISLLQEKKNNEENHNTSIYTFTYFAVFQNELVDLRIDFAIGVINYRLH